MKTKHFLMSLLLIFIFNLTCLADRVLERSEVLQLLEQLTAQPRQAWITAGKIESTHEEFRAAKITDENQIKAKVLEQVATYQANTSKLEQTEDLQKLKLDAIPFNTRYLLSNEYTMISSETVSYNGEQYHWEISVKSRTDSVKPEKNLAGNYMTDQFNMELNSRKIYAWDGEKYIKYSPLAGHSYVDPAGQLPHNVQGPLKAGLIPWGNGYYSYNNLAVLESEAIESTTNGNTQIELTFTNNDGSQMSFVLDASKEYAVLSSSIVGKGNSVITKQYSDYQNVGGNWVPMSILLEKRDAESLSLLAYDIWTFDNVDASVPGADAFMVDYEEDTNIEYVSPLTDKPLVYRYSSLIDTEKLLAAKLDYDAKEGTQPQNCATASMKYAIEQLGVSVDDSQLASLITEPENGTNLRTMKSFARNIGLNCRAIRTDLDTISKLSDCQLILYFPGRKHFVVVDSIDSYVRIVDIATKKFYDNIDVSFFDMDWPTGIAFVISNNAIQIQGDFQDLSDTELAEIVGAGGYSCTKQIQIYDIIFCQYVFEECMGNYTVFWPRYGCEAAESGSCSYGWFERYSSTPCIEDIYNPFGCDVTGHWTDVWIRACS